MAPENTGSGISYKDAGVDIDAKMTAIDRVKAKAKATLGPNAGAIGHLAAPTWSPLGTRQILVASADGVGTKVGIAVAAGGEGPRRRWDATSSITVPMTSWPSAPSPSSCSITLGCGKLDSDVMSLAVGGAADACLQSRNGLDRRRDSGDCRETYPDDEYDLVGFIVGTVDPDKVIDGSTIRTGDVVIGFPSAGLHTNGFSLARRIVGLTGDRENDRVVLAKTLPGAAPPSGKRCWPSIGRTSPWDPAVAQ